MRPCRLSARKTLCPNSTGLFTLPRLRRSVWGSKIEKIFSCTGTCSPWSTRRRVCAMTRSASPPKCSISRHRPVTRAPASGSPGGGPPAGAAAARGPGGARRRDDARGDAEEIAILARLLARALRGGQAADLLHTAPRPARAIRKPSEHARHVLAQVLDQPRDDADRIPEQRVVRGPMDVRLHHGGVDAELGAVLEAERDRGLDHGVVEGAHRGGREAGEGAVERVVPGHRLAVEGREAAQRVAVGDALAQFTEIPGLHPLEHEGPEDLGGAQAVAPRSGALEPADQIVVDERHELRVLVEEVGEGVQGRLQREPVGLQFEIGEGEGPGPRPHWLARPRCAIRNCRWATDIAWLSALRRLPSSTQAATVSRQAIGMYSVWVFCSSFQVNSAVSWSGPSVAHRQVGRPHRLVLTVSEPSRNGPRVRRRARIRRPAGLVSRARAMWDSIHTPHHPVNEKCPGRTTAGVLGLRAASWKRISTGGHAGDAAISAASPLARALRSEGRCGREVTKITTVFDFRDRN